MHNNPPVEPKTNTIFSFFDDITLTNEQKVALYSLETFFLEKNEQVFILSGYAGTGKTYLMQGVGKWLFGLKYSVYYTAPTGRAAKVLSYSTKQSASTLHREIYTFSSEEEGKTVFGGKERNAEEESNENVVFIIDEASLVGDFRVERSIEVSGMYYGSGKLLTDLIRYLNINSFSNTKIIFVGDEAQLPPIGMDFSPALDSEYLKNHFNFLSQKVILTQVMRHNVQSDIFTTAANLRHYLQHKYLLSETIPINHGKDVHLIPQGELISQYFRLSGDSPSANCIFLAHSNIAVTQFNIAVRNHYFPNMRGKVAVGDVLVIGNNTYHTNPNLNNGEIVKVVEVGDSYLKTGECPRGKKQEVQSNYLQFSNEKVTGSFKLRDIKIQVRQSNGSIAEVEIVILEDWLECADKEFPWTANHLLKSIIGDEFYHKNKINYHPDKTNPTRIQYEKDKVEYLRNDKFANAVRCKFGYALTVHKAQGGEWKNVLIDSWSTMPKKHTEYYRWLYTAITRAQNKIWISGILE